MSRTGRGAEALTRNYRFAWVLAAILLALLGASGVRATESAVAKAAAWRMGDDLSLAGLLYAQGGEEQNVEQLLSRLKPLAESMKIEVKPFPPKAATPIDTYAAVIEYLIKGDGAEIGRQIAKQFGTAAGMLFEISVKSNLLVLLYEPGEDHGMGSAIQARCNEVGLPNNLWFDVITAINRQAPKDEVKNAVFKMHDDVEAYLNQQVQ
jgi:hypothetical protein